MCVCLGLAVLWLQTCSSVLKFLGGLFLFRERMKEGKVEIGVKRGGENSCCWLARWSLLVVLIFFSSLYPARVFSGVIFKGKMEFTESQDG